MDWMELLRVTFGLAIVLGLILALAYLLRRYAPNLLARLSAPRGKKRMEIVETMVLDPTRRVVLVRIDDEERLILLGEGRELIEPRLHSEIKPVNAKPAANAPAEPQAAAPAAQPAKMAAPRPRPVIQPVIQPVSQPASQVGAARPKLAAVARPQPHSVQPPVAQVRPAPARPVQQDPNDDLF